MPVYETYSKRQRQLRGEVVDVFQYNIIPSKLRIQVAHVMHEVLGNREEARDGRPFKAYEKLVHFLRKDKGVFSLVPVRYDHEYVSPFDELTRYLTDVSTNEECLDAIELVFRAIPWTDDYNYLHRIDSRRIADSAINELNIRFKENGFGYQFVDGQIIRVDSQLLHAEAVKPALVLLNTMEYRGPHDEFINAYEHYKNGNNKEALVDCLKAFESTMKAICDKRRWTYDAKTATAKDLIAIIFAKDLVPSFWQQQFASLRSLLESSIPTGRNKMAGHGQGSTPTEVPDYITGYMLHMTASTLVFLTTAEKALP